MKMTFKLAALPLTVALTLAGCEDANYDFDASIAETNAAAPFTPVFDPANGQAFAPSDALYNPLTGDLIGLRADPTKPANIFDPRGAMSTLDGWGLSTPIAVSFTKTPNYADFLTAQGIPTKGVYLAKIENGVATPLPAGSFVVVPNAESMALVPLAPLSPSTKYAVYLTSEITDMAGDSMAQPTLYKALANGETFAECNCDAAALQYFSPVFEDAIGLNPTEADAADVVAWTFTTQSVSTEGSTFETAITTAESDILGLLGTGEPAQLYLASSGLSLAQANEDLANLPGSNAVIYGGYMHLVDFLVGDSIGTETWVNGSGETAGNKETALESNTIVVPVVAVLPVRPEGEDDPVPVTIFNHGITRNRSDMLAFAGSQAQVGRATISIDLPTHGYVADDDQTNPLNAMHADAIVVKANQARQESGLPAVDIVERHENQPADGSEEVSSGAHFYKLTSFLTTRDHVRQAALDTIQLRKALARAFVSADGENPTASFDTSDVALVGLSLGAITGINTVALDDQDAYSSFAAVAPGAGIAYLLDASPAFQSTIRGGLAAAGVTSDADRLAFLGAAQTTVDSVDPYATIATAAAKTDLMIATMIGDQVVPNTDVFNRMPLVGGAVLPKLIGLSEVGIGGDHYIELEGGHHASLLRPNQEEDSEATAEELQVTTALQTRVTTFVASGGLTSQPQQ
ncbi:MAG: hypothetical protein HWE20_05405 [Gammaproteobacteria bacterium]|nr:hypothetical protein [Gammaproteobacteria bacterium]